MVIGDVLYAHPKIINGIKRLEVMSDIIPLEVPVWAQLRVYVIQVSAYITKALYSLLLW